MPTINLKGWRTVAIGLGLALIPAALQSLAIVDWTPLLGASGAFFVSGMIQIAMRYFTTTPIGSSAPAAPQAFASMDRKPPAASVGRQ